MTEDRVTPETIKLASDKGIDWQSELLEPDVIGNEFSHKLPTQSLFQKFFREKYSIDINVITYNRAGARYLSNAITDSKLDMSGVSGYSGMGYSGYSGYNAVTYNSYEEALEAALQKAIELI